MLEITKTQDNGLLEKLNLNEAVSGSWFNLIDPTREEIQQVSLVLGLEENFISNSLDADELSRMEFEDGNLLIITNVPVMDEEGNFDTMPLGLIFTPECVITVCSHENKIINSFNEDTAKFFDTRKKANFMLSILILLQKLKHLICQVKFDEYIF